MTFPWLPSVLDRKWCCCHFSWFILFRLSLLEFEIDPHFSYSPDPICPSQGHLWRVSIPFFPFHNTEGQHELQIRGWRISLSRWIEVTSNGTYKWPHWCSQILDIFLFWLSPFPLILFQALRVIIQSRTMTLTRFGATFAGALSRSLPVRECQWWDIWNFTPTSTTIAPPFIKWPPQEVLERAEMGILRGIRGKMWREWEEQDQGQGQKWFAITHSGYVMSKDSRSRIGLALVAKWRKALLGPLGTIVAWWVDLQCLLRRH